MFDRDVKRAADFLGFSAKDAEKLRTLAPGEFYAMGPALESGATLAKIDQTITRHIGATPELIGSADHTAAEAEALLALDAMRALSQPDRTRLTVKGTRALDAFLLDPSATLAIATVQALARISPNATTCSELSAHTGRERTDIHDALDTLTAIGAIETTHREDTRIARLSARLRQKNAHVDLVALA